MKCYRTSCKYYYKKGIIEECESCIDESNYEKENRTRSDSGLNVLADGWRDDLPDDNKDVIIASKTHSGVGWYDKYSNEWKIRAVYFEGPVTHWQPLPLPPTVS